MPRTPLTWKQKMRRAELRNSRYRNDPEYRLKEVNKQRVRLGLPLATELPPVGEAKRHWASGLPRDDKGKWIQRWSEQERMKR